MLSVGAGDASWWPSSRFRHRAFAASLAAAGFRLAWWGLFPRPVRGRSWASAVPPMMGRLGAAAALPRPDLVWLQREAAPLGPALLERLFTRFGRIPYVYDVDDAVWLDPAAERADVRPEPALLRLLRHRPKVDGLIRGAAHVMAGNAFLADHARRLNPRTTVVPTVVDTGTRYVARHEHRHGRRPVVGWTGSHSTLGYLPLVDEALREVARVEPYDLAVVCDRPPEGLSVPVRFHPWSAQTELADLLTFDVGLMPLLDRDWERGKCGLKILQYMAAGVPPVASAVGVNREIVRQAVDGFLCASRDEWVAALAALLRAPGLRARMGAAARERVVERYSVAAQAPRVAEIFREVLSSARPQGR